MKFNFFKKIWGKKDKDQEKQATTKDVAQESKSSATEITAEAKEPLLEYNAGDLKIIPLITEKTSNLAARYNQYTFIVDTNVNRQEAKKAIEKIFKVQVTKVSIVNYKERIRGATRIKSRRKSFKKVIATLKPGQKIPLFE
ncbi:MAG: hypothetical protein KatS3mg097_425 [Candidatus Parcubacteria bacterium]|nr:MAG: hypothetical protein KatS3mg097_425 [Candidatus Parcubacteria bacterium]